MPPLASGASGSSQESITDPPFPPTAGSDVLSRTPLRSPDGRLQVVATEARTPVVVDGVLDDEVWERAQPVGNFVQSDPLEGEPATEPTEVWVDRKSVV